MRLLDLEVTVTSKLRDIPYGAYRCAIWVAGELAVSLYSEYYNDDFGALSRSTLDAAEIAFREGQSAGLRASSGLPSDWDNALSDTSSVGGPPAARSALFMLAALSSEISLEGSPREASGLVTAVISTYSGNPYRQPSPTLVINPRTQEVDERSLGAQLLRKINQAADLAVENVQNGEKRDCRRVYREVFDIS